MTLKNTNTIQEINDIFERIHIKLDQRRQQLLQQINIYSNQNNSIKLIFSPMNQLRLEENIDDFGCLITSKNTHRLTNSTLIPKAKDSMQTVGEPSMSKGPVNEANHDQYRIVGKHGRQKGQFSNPQDVLILSNSNRTLLVSDTINQNVQLFSLDTGLYTGIFLFSTKSKQLPLRRPIGLANTYEENSTCFVTDYDQHLISNWRIEENGNGKLIKKFGQTSLLGPKGICVSKQTKNLLVADNKGNRICLFDSSGELVHRFGTRGAELHQLAGPHYVRFANEDNDRTILVTDFYNNTVKIFDLERHGQFIQNFGSLGTKNGFFQAPTGLAIDYERGLIFVSDWGNNRIQIFDRQGTFIRVIELSTSDMLYGPQGLDYDPITHTLAIANSGKHSVLLMNII